MFRKRFLIGIGIVLLAALLAGFGSRPEVWKGMFRGKPKQWNVVLIVVDALRADRLGAYGSKKAVSPQIDKIAASGVVFDNCFAPLPMTQPSFSTMFTSLYPVSHGVLRNDVALSPKAVTLAEILKLHGWQTGAVVGASNLDSVFGLNQGFEFYEDSLGRKMDPEIKLVDRMKRWERSAEKVNQIVTQWLDKRPQKQNFFLMVHYYDPHKPYQPPPPFDSMYDRIPGDKISEANALYDGEVTYVDREIGHLLDELSKRHLRENTLIMITADHGEGLGDHNWMTHIWKIYDEAVHIPLIIAGPGIPAGRRVNGLVENVDYTPTVLDYLNLPLQSQFEGHSFLPLIQGSETEIRQYVLLEKAKPPLNFKELEPDWQKFPYSQWAIRTHTEKFIWSSDRKHEYYDLTRDPHELNNLFSTEHEKAMSLFQRGAAFRALFPRYNFIAPAVRSKDGNAADEALRALGYLN